MTSPHLDLFGDPVTLDKRRAGYLTSLSQLIDVPSATFWALAEPDPNKDRPKPADAYECVWLQTEAGLRRAWIDLSTGREAEGWPA